MIGYKRHVFVCLNERDVSHPKGCCKHRGSTAIFAFLKSRVSDLGLKDTVRISQAGCMEHCQYGPTVVVYPEAVWYRIQSLEQAKEIMDKHILGGQVVEHLRMELLEDNPSSEENIDTLKN